MPRAVWSEWAQSGCGARERARSGTAGERDVDAIVDQHWHAAALRGSHAAAGELGESAAVEPLLAHLHDRRAAADGGRHRRRRVMAVLGVELGVRDH
eukprot:scaffold60367_cov39-Phaeocystis_antarctica.AAC.1